jgi:hypothetical protein
VKRTLVLVLATAVIVPVLVGRAPAASSTPLSGGLPLMRDHGQGTTASSLPIISINWSGYAVTSSSKFTYVYSSFVQPAITCSGAKDLVTSNWVGLDGFANQTVEQDGTQGMCVGSHHKTPKYVAWYEMYPKSSVNVFSINAGDSITTAVSYTSGMFSLTVSDLTSHRSHSDVAACSTCQRASAEWIIERPAECANQSCSKASILALPNFGTSTMSHDVASDGGANTGITGFVNYAIEGDYNLNDTEKIGPAGFISVDTVSPVAKNTNSFTATWERSGEPVPITL